MGIALRFLSARAPRALAFTRDPEFDTIDTMDLAEWVEEAESLLRMDGLWPDKNEERARGVLEDAACRGPEPLVRAIRALRRELRGRDLDAPDRGPSPRWAAPGRP